jgi:hypothetical protein
MGRSPTVTGRGQPAAEMRAQRDFRTDLSEPLNISAPIFEVPMETNEIEIATLDPSTAGWSGQRKASRRRRRDGEARTCAMRSSAASRLRSCERCSEAVTVRTPSTSPERRSSARARYRTERRHSREIEDELDARVGRVDRVSTGSRGPAEAPPQLAFGNYHRPSHAQETGHAGSMHGRRRRHIGSSRNRGPGVSGEAPCRGTDVRTSGNAC